MNIHLVNIPIFRSSNGQDSTDCDHLGNGSKGLMIIQTFDLCVIQNNQTSFVPFNAPIRFAFNLIDSYTTQSLLSRG